MGESSKRTSWRKVGGRSQEWKRVGGNQEETMSVDKFGRYQDGSRRKDRKKGKAGAENCGEIGETLERYYGD